MKRTCMLSAAIFACCVLLRCAPDEAGRSSADGGAGGSSGADGGGGGADPGGWGGAGGTQEVPECARNFVEPDPCEFYLEFECGGQSAFCGGIPNLPPNANGACSHIYWLTEDERVCLTVTAYLGWSVSYPAPRAPLDITFWLDGIMVPFGKRDGEPGLHFWMNADGVQVDQELCLPPGVPGDGVHLLSVVFRARDRLSIMTHAVSTPLIRNSFCIEDFPETAVEAAVGYPLLNWTYDANGEILNDVFYPAKVRDGELGVTAVIDQFIPGVSRDGFVVAVLDGEQIPVGQHGLRPRLQLPEGPGNPVALPIHFEGLPVYGGDHWIDLIWLGGYGSIELRQDGRRVAPGYSTQVGAFHLVPE